jgi:nucleotidyltransferase/DNA polymerase involved in DNA repair
MLRLACFFVPMFSLAARLRSEPELREQAVAIVEGNGSNAHVIAATRRARTKGIRAGLSLAQARALLPKLIARGRDSECERTAQEALLEVAETFSPRIEDAGEGVVFFDVTGMEQHWAETADRRPPTAEESAGERRESAGRNEVTPLPAGEGGATDPERSEGKGAPGEGRTSRENPLRAQDSALRTSPELRLAQSAIRAAEAIGLPARCGIAGSKLAARVAAELPQSPTIVPAGGEPAFLAPLPLERLSPELEAAAILDRWGLTSIGDLARLPESEVASRLGEIGRKLHYAARGVDPRPLIPRPMPSEFREGMELEWPLVALEPFLFIANAALDRLSARMEMQGFACRRLELTMTLEPDGYHARAIDLPAPTRDVKTMLTLLRLDLEKNPPNAPVCGFSIVAHPDRPRRAQLSLFGPSALAPEKLATAIARLVALLGEGRVGMPVSVDGHLPDRFDIGDFAPPAPPDVKRATKKSRGLLAMRVFRPPIPVEVITRPSRSDEPGEVQIESVRSAGARSSAPATPVKLHAPHPALLPSASLRSVAPPSPAGRGETRDDNGNGTDLTTRRYEPFEPPVRGAKKSRVEVGASTEIEGSVRLSSGPWRVEEAWWADAPADRDYWDIELHRGGIYRVYRDEMGDGWFIDARYD